ncbi:hypothetical protein GCM10023085_43330 [Actinomadura viridis]
MVGPGAAVLRAIVAMVPPGAGDLRPDLNAIQTITAAQRMGLWRIVSFQTTPAQFHGRPDAVRAHTEELRQVLRRHGT